VSSVRRAGGESHARPLLHVLCGPSHAGKSTFAERHCKGFEVVSSDRIREGLTGRCPRSRREARTWETFERQKWEALSKGRDVVLDACHLSKRARWHSVQGPNDRHRKVFVLFDVPLGTVLARCRRTGRLPLLEAERMWRAFQASKPTTGELRRLGFDEVHLVGDGGRRRVRLGREPPGRGVRRLRNREPRHG
jgi:predicted kinase